MKSFLIALLAALFVFTPLVAAPESEEAIIYELEYNIAKQLIPIAKILGATRLYDEPKRVGRKPDFPHRWKIGGKKDGDKRKDSVVNFMGFSLTDGETIRGKSEIVEGKSEPGIHEVLEGGPEGFHEELERELTTYEETQSSFSKESYASLEIINKFSAHAEGGVDGVGSATIDEENTTTVTAGTSSSEAGSNTNRREVRINAKRSITIPPNAIRQLVIDINRATVITPIQKKGTMNPQLNYDIYNWAGNNTTIAFKKGEHWNIVKVDNYQHLKWFFQGERKAEYPNMTRFEKKCNAVKKCAAALKWLYNPKNFEISAKGQEKKDYPAKTHVRILCGNGKACDKDGNPVD